MKLQTHAIAGCSLGIAAYFLLGWDLINSIFFFLYSVLIDVDHVFDFLWRSRFQGLKNFNIKSILKDTYDFEMACASVDRIRKRDILIILVFHTGEFLLATYLLKALVDALGYSFFSGILMAIFWGALLHMILDIVYNVKTKRLPSIRTLLLIEYLIRKWLMKRKGVDIDKTFQEILKGMQQPSKKT